mgnify:CR=1 FL=1
MTWDDALDEVAGTQTLAHQLRVRNVYDDNGNLASSTSEDLTTQPDTRAEFLGGLKR